jgi:hypothetical protein
MKKLTPYEESIEISLLARDFVGAIFRGGISSPQGPYALTSKLRPDHHIGTSSAPVTLLARMEHLKDRVLREGATADAYSIVRNLEQTVEDIGRADRVSIGPGSRLSAEEQSHVQRNIGESLPGMRDAVENFRSLLKPQI